MINKILRETKGRLSMRVVIPLITIMFVLSFALVLVSQAVQAGDPPRTYFRFAIPTNADGTRVSYSPGWFGMSDKCPNHVTVVYYNDKEGYGLAYTTDTWVTKEAVLSTSLATEDVLSKAKDEIGVFYGSKLLDRWLPEIKIEVKECVVDSNGVISILSKGDTDYKEIVYKEAIVCPVCGEFIDWAWGGIGDTRFILTCPKGHRLVTRGY